MNQKTRAGPAQCSLVLVFTNSFTGSSGAPVLQNRIHYTPPTFLRHPTSRRAAFLFLFANRSQLQFCLTIWRLTATIWVVPHS